MNNTKLPSRQLRFVQEYAIDCNGAAAATRAGYSAHTAAVQASRLLSKANVRTMVDAALARLAAKTETSSMWVRRRLKEEAEDFSKGANAASRVRAIELTGRLNGDFAEDRRNNRSALESFGTDALKALELDLAERLRAAGTTH